MKTTMRCRSLLGMLCVLGLPLVLAGCGGGGGGSSMTSPTPVPSGPGVISFGSDRAGINQIFLMSPDGTVLRQLSDGGFCRDPKISRDGKQVVFNSSKSGNFEVYIVNTDATGLKKLTSSPTGYAGQPSLNPARTLVAYVLNNVGSQIMLMKPDGTDNRALTTGGIDSEPVFSPDGKQVTFFSNRTGNNDIWIVNVDGTGLTNLTNSPAKDEFPSFTNDGKSIIFSSDRRGSGEELHVINIATKKVTYIPVGITARRAFYNPAGTKIVFEHETYPYVSLYKVNADGSNLVALTGYRNGLDTLPSWGASG